MPGRAAVRPAGEAVTKELGDSDPFYSSTKSQYSLQCYVMLCYAVACVALEEFVASTTPAPQRQDHQQQPPDRDRDPDPESRQS